MIIRTRDHDRALARLIAQHGGPVARWQAREHGIPAAVLRRRMAAGHARAWFGDVVLFGWEVPPPRDVRVAAAVLAGGPGAALGGEEAAARLGAWNRSSGMIDVWCVRHRTTIEEPDIRLRRLGDSPHVVTTGPHALPAVEPVRIVRQLANEIDPWQLAYVIERLRATGQLDHETLLEESARWTGRPGATTLHAAVDLHLADSLGTMNRTEDRLRRALVGRLPPPLVNVRNATGLAGTVPDYVWLDELRIVEVDGTWTHDLPGMTEADAQRDLDHRALGFPTLRIGYRRVWTDLDGVVDEVVRFVRGRRPAARARNRAFATRSWHDRRGAPAGSSPGGTAAPGLRSGAR